MQLYSPIILKFALGIICLIIQINLMGKGNLAPLISNGSSSKLCFRGNYWWSHL